MRLQDSSSLVSHILVTDVLGFQSSASQVRSRDQLCISLRKSRHSLSTFVWSFSDVRKIAGFEMYPRTWDRNHHCAHLTKEETETQRSKVWMLSYRAHRQET